MRTYKLYILSGLALFLFSFIPPEKTVREYNIHVAGMKVGQMIAIKQIENDYTTYTLNSDVSVYIIKRYRVIDNLKAVYKDNILQYATVKTNIGKNEYFSAIIWTKDHYDVNVNGYKYQNHTTITKQIDWSVAKAYFEAPPSSAKVFSEDFGIFSDADYIGPNINQLVYKGKKNKFTYSNGIMVKADIQNNIRDFILTLK